MDDTERKKLADAMAHVVVEAGVVPGVSYGCRCEQCRLVAKSMDDAHYMDHVKDQWWNDETEQ